MQTSPEDEVFRLIAGYRASQAIGLAVELGIPDRVADGPQTAAALATATGTHESSLARLLRGLCALGVLSENDDGAFSATPLSSCLRSGQWAYAQARMSTGEGYAAWAQIGHTIKTGKPAYELVHGVPRWEHLAQNPESARRFNAAMAASADLDGKALGDACDLTEVSTIVDVGGGRGALIAAVLAARPAIHGVIVDLAAGLEGAPDQLSTAGVGDRCKLVTGSFFDAVPSSGDVYILRWILHDWDDERASRIIQVCTQAMPPDGRLLVIERLMPERIHATPADFRLVMADLQMMLVLGGRERTEAEFAQLFETAGLRLQRKAPLPSGSWMLEARHV